MKRNEVKTFDDLKNTVEHMAETVDNISICILGDPKKPGDLGMRGDVRNNVRWKKSVQKVIGVLGFGVLTMWAKDVYSYFKG